MMKSTPGKKKKVRRARTRPDLLSCLCMACCLALAAPAAAGDMPPPFETTDARNGTSITVYSEFLRDPDDSLSFSQILDGDLDREFRPAGRALENAGLARGTWWVRFALRNSSEDHQRLLLELRPSLFEKVTLHKPGREGYQVRHAGSDTRLPWGDIPHRSPLFELSLAPDEKKLVHMRLVPRHNFRYGLVLHEQDHPVVSSPFSGQLFLLFAGTLLGLMCYNLGTFLLYGGRAYLHYASFLFSMTLMALATTGFLGVQHLAYPGLQPLLEKMAIFLLAFSGMAFSSVFLNAPALAPRLHRALQAAMGVALVGLLLSPALSQRLMFELALLVSATGMALVFWLSVLAWRNRSSLAPLHLIARLPVLVAALGAMLVATGFWSPQLEPAYLLLMATNVEALLFAIGLSQKSRDELRDTLEIARSESVEEATRQARSDTLSRLSHEIRTPMSGILGMVEILRDTPLTRNQRECLDGIQESGEGLLHLLNDVLEHARLEEDSAEPELRPVNLSSVLMDAVELFGERAEECGIELITHIHTNVPTRVQADSERLKQTLTAVLGSCIRHAQPGELVIDVARDISGRPDHFSFRLEGSALAGTDPLIFNSLLEQERALSDDSTHLSLSIARQLIEGMGGSSSIRTGDQGTAVEFILPLPASPDGPSESLPEYDEILEGRSMLVVDDSSTFTRVVWLQALSWGMRVTTCHDAREALAAIRSQDNFDEPFDLLMLDQNIPGMDGMELVRRIEQDEDIRSRPLVIMLTGVRGAPSVRTARDAGIHRVVRKPVSGPLLKRILAESLDNRPPPRDTTEPESRALDPELHILVAEDHGPSRKVIRNMLEKLGVEPVIVNSGQEVLQAWRESTPDLILMDCEMPGMDGFDAARAIREEETATGRAPVPILALTAHVMPRHRQQGREAGMNDHLAKPVEMEALYRAIRDFTDGDGRQPDSRRASGETRE